MRFFVLCFVKISKFQDVLFNDGERVVSFARALHECLFPEKMGWSSIFKQESYSNGYDDTIW